MSLKILYFILDGFPTFRPDIAALFGRYLFKEGIESDLVTMENPTDSTQAEWPAGLAFVFKRPRSKIKESIGSFLYDLKQMRRSATSAYDAIQVRDKSFTAWFAKGLARRKKIPFFYWMSFPMVETYVRIAKTLNPVSDFPRWFLLWVKGHVGGFVLYKMVLPQCDHVFVQSDKMLSDMIKKGVPMNKMTPVPMCIDPVRFENSPERALIAAIPEGRRIIGYLGECSRIRRPDFLFEALAHIRKSEPAAFLLIVGDSYEQGDRPWLSERMEHFGVTDHVHITGWLPSDQVQPLFANAEIALALMAPDPILDSTTPTKLVEYLAMGFAVVANDHPDQSLVLDESRAGLVTPFEPTAYGDAVLQLLKDSGGRQAMAQRGRDYVIGRRNYPAMARFLSEIYRSLVYPGNSH